MWKSARFSQGLPSQSRSRSSSARRQRRGGGAVVGVLLVCLLGVRRRLLLRWWLLRLHRGPYLLRRLRQLRLIRSPSDAELDSGEAWLTIRPGIISLVTDSALAQLASPEIENSEDQPSAEESN